MTSNKTKPGVNKKRVLVESFAYTAETRSSLERHAGLGK